ncbi:7-carboxy-7-deazaguanine synthase QueE [Aestuariibacter sp. A3R04]|uniref:7-carboxy-7-deazaguanine synthase QueE n=1 Tax=Aestuariibacter sp. A3R04 TaxID=2841571 RepID=UPI001C09B976|nr:7-carboxy-7-deazaguanine synthase QueE [Aestuariibacter sp. A3R04]MBU3022376.1 7-carboxy-7-deazaguanine synthase QueE [Aestuariibacter sp. A3R04]
MLKINEMFETIQGEGAQTGVPSIFVRLQGCPVGCSWCDTKHTWTLDDAFLTTADAVMSKGQEDESHFTADESSLLALFRQRGYTASHVVITGGEPCMYDLRPLTGLLHSEGYSTQIETSGTFEVLCNEKTFVTVSPKVNMKGGMPVLTSALDRANEIKHPVAMQKHVDELDALLQGVADLSGKTVCLQPISQQARATELAITTCIARNWRLSLQTHKYIGIE